MEHSLTSSSSVAREEPEKLNINPPGLKKLSLRPVSVFDIAKAEINQLSFGTLIDCIETG